MLYKRTGEAGQRPTDDAVAKQDITHTHTTALTTLMVPMTTAAAGASKQSPSSATPNSWAFLPDCSAVAVRLLANRHFALRCPMRAAPLLIGEIFMYACMHPCVYACMYIIRYIYIRYIYYTIHIALNKKVIENPRSPAALRPQSPDAGGASPPRRCVCVCVCV